MRHVGRDTDEIDVNDIKKNIEQDGFILVQGIMKDTRKYVEPTTLPMSKQNVVSDIRIVSWSLT